MYEKCPKMDQKEGWQQQRVAFVVLPTNVVEGDRTTSCCWREEELGDALADRTSGTRTAFDPVKRPRHMEFTLPPFELLQVEWII